MVNFNILPQNKEGVRYRLGVLEVSERFCSMYGGDVSSRPSRVETASGPLSTADGDVQELGVACIATPSFTIPTLGGFPQCILPRMELGRGAGARSESGGDGGEVASLMPEVDYLLMGQGLDLERVWRRRRGGGGLGSGESFDSEGFVSTEVCDEETDRYKEEKEKRKNCDKNERRENAQERKKSTREKRVGNATRFDLLKQPPPQLANKDYVKYLMFRQPLFPGEEPSCWNGPGGILIQTGSGRVSVGVDDVIASVEHFEPAFFISPAEEARTGQHGKKVSFRSIRRADEILLAVLERLRRRRGSGTRVLANIQGAHFLEYRVAAALGVWDICRGTGRGLSEVGFAGGDGSAELRKGLSGDPEGKAAAVGDFDQLVLGVAIGGLGYSEKLSERAECIMAVVDHIPVEKLRLLSLDTGSPIELLQAVYTGVDVIECPYIYKCSLSGVALSFNLSEFVARQEAVANYTREEKMNAERFLLGLGSSNATFGTDDGFEEELDKERVYVEDKEAFAPFGGARCIDLKDRAYSCDSAKLTENSPVPHSRAYVHHLINSGEILGFSLLFMHNYWQYQGLLLLVRRAILDGRLEDFVTWFMYTQTDIQIHPIKLPEPTLETYTFDGMKGRLQKKINSESR